jgi:hypothetical protein
MSDRQAHTASSDRSFEATRAPLQPPQSVLSNWIDTESCSGPESQQESISEIPFEGSVIVADLDTLQGVKSLVPIFKTSLPLSSYKYDSSK